jgi:hypothetical protein
VADPGRQLGAKRRRNLRIFHDDILFPSARIPSAPRFRLGNALAAA